MNIVKSARAYEDWLGGQLKDELVKKDIKKKHKKMAAGPFEFLRATYWRWAEAIFDVCPDLAEAPSVLAVGDIHLENFGTWRDADGRLTWGVNDFDEASEMPYVLDLVRLAVSAVLARKRNRIPTSAICAGILDGYRAGLKNPGPFVLDDQHRWLRDKVSVSDRARAGFWQKIDAGLAHAATPRRRYVTVLNASLPAPIDLTFFPRTAGTGSLGRPRFIGYGEWRGAPLVREAKALVASGWTLAHKSANTALRCADIANGSHRSPDPWYKIDRRVLVRRLSPNNRKIEVADDAFILFDRHMIEAMGHELASVHRGVIDRAEAIKRDLDRRTARRFRAAVEAAAEFVAAEQKTWKNKGK